MTSGWLVSGSGMSRKGEGINESAKRGRLIMEKQVVRRNKERCSYKCPYYQDGPVLSLCNKYNKQLKYDGQIPPLLAPECKAREGEL